MASSSSISDNKEESSRQSSLSSRRNFLFLASSTVAATAVATQSQNPINSDDGSIALPSFFSPSSVKPMNIAQAVQWIDDNCDRRFLHAVIASDYRFLYRGVSMPGSNMQFSRLSNNMNIETQHLTPDLLTEGTYGDESTAALELFKNLQEVLKDDMVNPSNGHLATSSVNDAAEWGMPASIWPVDGAHYAWFQDKELFYPRPSGSVSATSITRNDLIVDGKDCGKESLEDALRAPSCEVMVASAKFLVVPAGLDEKLRDSLKSSFLV
eukprot:CAMPEP_0203671448 /NCGR_PEP_ID=MMETSP0090-20130426/7237_1 /ASSEMBLY_ACC=CAM_ASM_001088 /TAXON_ID=426623 /ORGANISM="Chaetoceros affinis, Strain CCMP159" /LENGTH=267 /DNA_ID=CAMNT_0050536525 /DNA_START=136 /DNA_END=939 /DNA_ORIENTATION=-